jgi:hypothetical protein
MWPHTELVVRLWRQHRSSQLTKHVRGMLQGFHNFIVVLGNKK